jgi:hypothetical protein
MTAETIPAEPEHSQWCVGGTRRVHRVGAQCLCLAECCVRIRNNGQYQCICEHCDGMCGTHLDNGPVTA